MKRHLIYLFASAALLTAGCSQEPVPGEKGYGSIRMACTADGAIDTAPQSRASVTELPDANLFTLAVAGVGGFDRAWENIDAFNNEELLLTEGGYTASVAYGDPEQEGPVKPYYTGSKTFTVVARQTSQVEVVAQLANAQTVVRATQQFLDYFHDLDFTVTTGSGNKFGFRPDAEGYVEEPVYVKAGTSLSLVGTARRQSQTGAGSGLIATFDQVTVDAAFARKRHVFLLDWKQGGGATLKITIGTDYTEEHTLDFEMNDAAIPDQEPGNTDNE